MAISDWNRISNAKANFRCSMEVTGRNMRYNATSRTVVTALVAGEIAGAALDVYEPEPLPSDHRLWTLPNVLLTPHMAGHGPYLNDRRF
jgi:hypothetical protein